MNNLFLICILLIIIIYNIFQTSTFENYESKTSAQYESNKSIEDAKITGFETGFSGSGSNITNDITRLDYKFAKNSDELLELTKYKPYTKENQDNLDVEYLSLIHI